LRTLARLKKLEDELRRAAQNPEDQDAIHDLRVAIRRFQQCIRMFAQFFEPAKIKKIKRRLRKLMDLCGAARNYDIGFEVLKEAGVDDPHVVAAMEKERGRANKELVRGLPSWRKRQTTRRWRAELLPKGEEPGIWETGEAPGPNARRVLPALAQQLFRDGDAAAVPESTHQELHRFRLQVKRFRYTLELFEPVYRAEMNLGIAMLRGLQDRLGAISDCGATLQVVKKHRSAAAAVRKLLDARASDFREYWTREMVPQKRDWWNALLGPGNPGVDAGAEKVAQGKLNGTVYSETRRSGTPRTRKA
jgi:CHAD domain-containing protein